MLKQVRPTQPSAAAWAPSLRLFQTLILHFFCKFSLLIHRGQQPPLSSPDIVYKSWCCGPWKQRGPLNSKARVTPPREHVRLLHVLLRVHDGKMLTFAFICSSLRWPEDAQEEMSVLEVPD